MVLQHSASQGKVELHPQEDDQPQAPEAGSSIFPLHLHSHSASSSSCGFNPSDFASDDDDVATLSFFKTSVPQMSGRKRNMSEATWNSLGSFAGMAEVVKVRGQLLRTTGIVRQGKIFLHIEEVGYLMQREALRVFDGTSTMNILDMYKLIMTGEYGCSWDAYKVYLELKTLGYIVGRHNVPWSISSVTLKRFQVREISEQEKYVDAEAKGTVDFGKDTLSVCMSSSRDAALVSLDKSESMLSLSQEFRRVGITRVHEGFGLVLPDHCKGSDLGWETVETNPQQDSSKESTCDGVHLHSNELTCKLQGYAAGPSRELKLMFDVFPPNTKFRKTDPGIPEFSVCIQSDHPPERVALQALEAQNEGISVKIAAVDCGRVNFFEFNTVKLACMP